MLEIFSFCYISGILPNTILNVPRTPKSPEDLNSERFHLALGLCVKALCSTRLTYSSETVTSCVNAVNCLLEAPWARNCIGSDSVSIHTVGLEVTAASEVLRVATIYCFVVKYLRSLEVKSSGHYCQMS